MDESEDRVLAEDLATPVVVEPGVDYATPEEWDWRVIAASQPNAALFHINHSDVTQVFPDVLRPSDSPPEAPFKIIRDIPIIIIDSMDQFWAGESRTVLPLNGLRVPIAGDTVEEAKQKLAADLAAQARLLLLLSTSRDGQLAPQLQINLALLTQVLAPKT
jgi:hypothetical protein